MRITSGITLLLITITALAVMWQPAYWAIALPEIAIFCVAIAWLVWCLKCPGELRSSPALILVLVAALWPLVQLAFGITIYRWQTWTACLYWAMGAAVIFVGLQSFSDPKVMRFYLRALVVLGFVMAVLAPLQRFTSDSKIFWMFEVPYSNIAMGPFVYPNQYAAFIELLLPVALAEAFLDRSGWRTLHGLSALVMYASVIASISRTGFALTSLEILVVPILAAKQAEIPLRQLRVPALIFAGLLIVLGAAAGPDALFHKLQQKDPFQGRREYVESSLQMIRDRPLAGVGIGNWSAAYPGYAVFDDGLFANQAHNDWAQWIVEGGIPFALLMVALAVFIVPKTVRVAWGVGVTAVFLQCLVDYPIQRIAVAIVFFTLISAVSSAGTRRDAAAAARKRAWCNAKVRRITLWFVEHVPGVLQAAKLRIFAKSADCSTVGRKEIL